MKKELWKLNLEQLKKTKSPSWTPKDLERALLDLKTIKTRDPHGLLNEIFKKDYAGENLKAGILSLMNLVKDELFIPDFFKHSNITSIQKKQGAKADSMENERGLFVQSLFKRVLENLIFNDKRESLQRGMSTSNIGGRKNKSSCDHLFVAHEIINSVINWEGEDTDFFIYDNRRHLINYIWKVVQWKLLIHYQCMKI